MTAYTPQDIAPQVLSSASVQALLVDGNALSQILGLAPGEKAEFASFNPHSGEYRVYHVRLDSMAAGGLGLVFEIYRQSPQLERRIFKVLSLVLAPAGRGLSRIASFQCDAAATAGDLPQLLPLLARITGSVRARTEPQDEALFPLLSVSSRRLWVPLVDAGAA